MKVLIWHDEIETNARWQVAFGRRGHDVRRARSAEEAAALLRQEGFDLLIFDLVVGEEGGLAVALMAEFHQPGIASILITDRQNGLLNDMFARLSSLRCVLGVETVPDDLVTIGEAAVQELPGSGARLGSAAAMRQYPTHKPLRRHLEAAEPKVAFAHRDRETTN